MLRSQTVLRRRCLGILSSCCSQALSSEINSPAAANPSRTILSTTRDFLSDTEWRLGALGAAPSRSIHSTAGASSRRSRTPPRYFESGLAIRTFDDEQVLKRKFSIAPRNRYAHAPVADATGNRRLGKGGNGSGRPRAWSSKAEDSSRISIVEEGNDDGVGNHHGSAAADAGLGKRTVDDSDIAESSSSRGRSEEWSGSISSESSDESDLSDVEIIQPQDLRFEMSSPELLEQTSATSLTENSAVLEAVGERGEFDLVEAAEMTSNESLPEPDMTIVDDLLEGGTGPPYLHTLSLDEAYRILEKARAKDLRHVHVGETCEWVDCMIFASGRSLRHIRGMADALVYNIKKSSRNVGPNSLPTVEGRDGEQWMVVDCGSLVIHLFVEEARSYFKLEEFWRSKSERLGVF